MIGKDLDKYGDLYGIPREKAEPDDSYHARILETIMPAPETRSVPYDGDPYRFCELDPSVYSFRVKAEYVHDDIDPRCLCRLVGTSGSNCAFDKSECPLHREGVKSLGQQVREALVGCADHPMTLAERAAFRELAAVITDAGAEQLRRFLR